MANVAGNPIKIDTVFTATAAVAAGFLPSTPVYLDEIYWLNPTNSGDTFAVDSPDQSQVYRTGRCESANQSQVFQMYGRQISNFCVPTLGSGTLYIYYH